MRLFGLASLLLVSMFASNVSAGFIPVDNFDDSNTTGNYVTRGFGGAGGTGVSGGSATFVGADLTAFNLGFQANVTYTNPNLNASGRTTLRLSDIAVTSGGLNPINATATVFSGGNLAATPSVVLNGSDLLLDFGSVNFSNITSISLNFQSSSAFTFTASGLQAVPEPTTMALIGLVGAGGSVAGWRRRRAAKA